MTKDANGNLTSVAPVRERGLKCEHIRSHARARCRSREGAWIEILTGRRAYCRATRRSREGAWIEIAVSGLMLKKKQVAPVRERGLKLLCDEVDRFPDSVAPVRERGLKSFRCQSVMNP